MTSPCMLSEAESDIFTVSKVAASPIANPLNVSHVSIKKLEFDNTMPKRRKEKPPIPAIIDA